MAGGIGAYSSQDVFAQDARRRAAMYANQNMQSGYAQQAAMHNAAYQQYLDEMSLMAAQQSQQVQTVQKAEGCTDGKDDGVINGWQKLKHFGKGIGNFFKGLIGFDKDGNWSAGRLLKNVAIGAGIAAVCVLTAGTAVPAIIAGAGVLTAAGGIAKSAYQANQAKTDAEARAAWEGLGSNTVALAASVVGAKATMKQVPGVDPSKYTGIKGTLKATWDSTTIGFKQAGSALKSGYQAYKAGGWQALKTTVTDSANGFWGTVKGNWNNATKQLTVQENQNNRIKDLDNQINEFKAKAEAATGRDKAKYNSQVKRLEARKADIVSAYDDINAVTSLKDAQTKIVELEQQIVQKQNALTNTTNKFTQTKLNKEISALQSKLDVYNQVTNQKVSLARNIRSELESIAKKEADGQGSAQLTARKNELLAQQRDLKFEIPGKSEHALYNKKVSESAQDLVKKQQNLDKAKAEYESAQKAYKEFKQGDTSAERLEAFRLLTETKDAFRTATRELQQAQIQNKIYKSYQSASSGYDYVGTYLDKATQFGKTFNNLYGSKDIPLVGGKKVPFTKYTLPTSVPRSYMLVGSNEYVNPSVGGPSMEEMMLAQMGVTPQQLEAFNRNKAALDNLYAMQQSVPQGYYGYYQAPAQPSAGSAPTLADYQQLESIMRLYGIA